MRRYNKIDYSQSTLQAAAQAVTSWSDFARALSADACGQTSKRLQRYCKQYSIDTTHFKSTPGARLGAYRKQVADMTNRGRIRIRLMRERGHECEACHHTDWMGEPIMIEMDHVDGDRFNNDPTNLRLLCPNCHAQTRTWRGRKRST